MNSTTLPPLLLIVVYVGFMLLLWPWLTWLQLVGFSLVYWPSSVYVVLRD